MHVRFEVLLAVTGGTVGIAPETLAQILQAAIEHGIQADQLQETIAVESVTEVGTEPDARP